MKPPDQLYEAIMFKDGVFFTPQFVAPNINAAIAHFHDLAKRTGHKIVEVYAAYEKRETEE